MISETRKTAAGTEYWDNKDKKVLFVPVGKSPNFEVTENPKSMIMGVDVALSKDMTTINGEPIASTMGISEEGEIVDLSNMTIKELKEYAASKEIEIPSSIRKQTDIAQYLYENWKPDVVDAG